MPSPTINSRAIPLAAIGVGASLWAWGAQMLASGEDHALEFEPNIACINGSPFGKTLAITAQGSIDFYWHEGEDDPNAPHVHGPECADGCAHEDSEAHVHGPECADGCDHNHAGEQAHVHGPECDHGCTHHHEEDAAHEHGPECADGCDHGNAQEKTHAHGPECADGCSHDHPEPPANTQAVPLMAKAKAKLESLSAATFEKSTDEPMSPRHKRYISSKIEKKLEFAHRLDPLNYTNFNNLYLFYSANELGKTLKSPAELRAMAEGVRNQIDENSENPEPWLTAAATQEICFTIRYNWEKETTTGQDLFLILKDYHYCMAKFLEKRSALEQAGIWNNISEKRRIQMEDRFLFLSKLYKAKQTTLEQWVPHTPAVSATR